MWVKSYGEGNYESNTTLSVFPTNTLSSSFIPTTLYFLFVLPTLFVLQLSYITLPYEAESELQYDQIGVQSVVEEVSHRSEVNVVFHFVCLSLPRITSFQATLFVLLLPNYSFALSSRPGSHAPPKLSSSSPSVPLLPCLALPRPPEGISLLFVGRSPL